MDFCKDFFLTFIYHYIAFKSRNPEYLRPESRSDFEVAANIAKKEGLDYLGGIIKDASHAVAHEEIDILWEIARDAPQTIAFRRKEFIVQMIDEFQFMNAMFYWAKKPEDEAVEMVYKYSRFFDVPITEETAYLMFKQTEGSPFYISSIIRSRYRDKDLTTVNGLTDTLEFETLDRRGNIKANWMEYVSSTFKKVNDKNAKKEEIREFDVRVIRKEYSEELKKLKKQYDSLLGKFNYQKGYFAEYLILERLRLYARKNNDLLKSITRYLPEKKKVPGKNEKMKAKMRVKMRQIE